MKKIILLFLVLLCFEFTYAQKFEPGYYVKKSGDTVKTDVFLQKKGGMLIRVRLKDNTAYIPIDIFGAGTSTERYVSKIASIDKSPKFTRMVTDTVFLEVLVRGKENLLYYIDENDKSHYFFETPDGNTEEFGLKFLDKGDGVHFQRLETYKDALKKHFPSCTQLFPEIDDTPFTRLKVQNLYIKLYECAFGPLSKQHEKAESIVQFGLLGGFSLTNIRFTNGDSPFASQPTLYKFGTATDLIAGIAIDARFARTGKRFTLRNEFVYRSYSAAAPEVVDISLFQNSSKSSATVSASYFKYNIVLRHHFSYDRVRPFFNLGFPIGYLLSHKDNAVITDTSFGQSPRVYDAGFLGTVSTVEIGLLAGLGVAADNLAFEVRGEYSGGLSPQNAKHSPVSTLYFLLSYQFGKYIK